MPYSQVAIDKNDYILFIGDGSIQSADEYFGWCLEAGKKADEFGCKRLLMDHRTLSLELTQIDVLLVGEQLYALNGQTLGFRFAVLPSLKTPEISGFIETVFTNRSNAYKLFDSREEALKWLLA